MTNNTVKTHHVNRSYFFKSRRLVKSQRTNIFFGLTTGVKAKLVAIQIRLVSNQKLTRIQRRAYRQLQSKMFGLWEKYENGERTAAQLLKSMSVLLSHIREFKIRSLRTTDYGLR